MNQGCYVLFNYFGSYRNIMQFKISYRRETGKEILESWRLEFLKKFLTNNFAWSGAEDNTSGLLNRGGMADLPSLRTLLAICQKSREPIFWEVIDSFVLVAYTSLTVSKILLQELLACLNFTLNSQDLFCCYKRRKWFLWTMAAAQAAKNHEDEWGLTWHDEGYIHQFRTEPFRQIQTWTHSVATAEALSLKISFHITSLKWSQRPSQPAWE